MGIAPLAFYLFAATVVVSGFLVVVAKNPVHSVLWLILAFLSTAGLFVMMGAEFVAMLLVIVYVGAVAVLFLFVVMMLDVDFTALREGFVRYLPIGALVGVVLLVQLGFVVAKWTASPGAEAARMAPAPDPAMRQNTAALGDILYTDYFHLFQLAGLVLLVAMIGAIVLTLRHREGVKRQDVLAQMYRDPSKALELKDIKPGQGL
jgi:NADH-quinone oxidoreductase subunit J